MAGSNGSSTLDLKKELLAHGRSFSFFQAIRLLQYISRSKKRPGDEEGGAEQNLQIRPELSMAFPAADIASIEALSRNAGYSITATFLGLYGTASPLPAFYTEDLFRDAREDSTAARDFMDIFHRRLFLLLYESWKKYRVFVQVTEGNNHSHLGMLYAITGLPGTSIDDEGGFSYALVRYAGLFGGHPRSALALQTVLTDALRGPAVEIISCIPRPIVIPPDQRLRLGGDYLALGKNSFLGQELMDAQGKFRVRIGPLSQQRFRSMLPGGSEGKKLSRLVKRFLIDPLDYDFELVVAEGETKHASLGGSYGSKLGLDTVLFTGAYVGQLSVIFPPEE